MEAIMELAFGVIVLLVLLGIALFGLVVSSRNAARNNASRQARPGPQTVHPAEQQTQRGATAAHPSYGRDIPR
jgi:CHASE3 domain sensor protein